MRKALLATLALSPVLLHAQANSPAQPQTTLESRLAAPAAPAVPGTATTTKPRRVSTGVVSPKLIHSTTVSSENTWLWGVTGGAKTIVVGMIVDPNGVPTELKIVKSAGPEIDHNVLAAVSQYRFKPGTVSDQPVAFPLNLAVNLTTPSLR
jgi:TonB family protein